MRWFVAVAIVATTACSGSSSDSSESSATESVPSTEATTATTAASTSEPVEATTTIAAEPLTAAVWFASDEEVPADDVLPAFAALIGPVPGVEPMDIEPSDGVSLTPLINRVLAGYDSYSPEQQAAILALVAPDAEGGPGGFRRPQQPASIESDLQTVLNSLIPELDAMLGWAYPLEPPTVHYSDTSVVHSDGSYAEAIASSWTGRPLNESDCDIYIGNVVSGATLTVIREKLAHELFHCYQYAYFEGSMSQFDALGGWRTEGTAAWVGLSLAGGASTFGVDEWWRNYLQGQAGSAYALNVGWGYHAVGFWSFIQERRGNTWNLVLPQLRASSDAEAFQQVTGDDTGLMAAWASSTTRQGWSSSWDTTGPGITSDERTPAAHTLATGASTEIAIQNLQNRVDRFDPASDVEYIFVSVQGVGTLSFSGDQEQPMVNRHTRFCLIDDCLCPDGSPPFEGAPYAEAPAEPLWIGTGSLSGGPTNLTVIGLTKDDVCRPCEGADGGAGSGFRAQLTGDECPDPCLNGKWVVDNGVLADEFRRLASSAISSVDVTGATIWEFDSGHLVVTYGHTLVATAPLDAGLTLVQTEAFSGQVDTDYSAVAGLFDAFNQSSSAAVTSSSAINGRSGGSTTTPIPANSTIGVDGSYECLGNDLTIQSFEPAVTAVLHRVTPED